ncbi:TonB-dependent receptor [Microcoleus sp. FACHB-68]|uniref:TonB-dependent receptor plug domain-containing protein n=1 Tax=Microcoleus sp. FACHB-68 TaxID=2692826 RepID=UPI0016867922|nr:TonB-dependent receptor [Microcoleus sp. FACHB-68]MBD1939764.1 TonB-dependent receptor [Microcoleus sp. FACHB-68]
MKLYFVMFGVSCLCWGIMPAALANPHSLALTKVSQPKQSFSEIPRLSDIRFPHTRAELLVQQPILPGFNLPKKHQVEAKLVVFISPEKPVDLIVTAVRNRVLQSTSAYEIYAEEIQQQGSSSAAEVLRGLPGFAINDAGKGADIHTGTYYRGHSINQSVFLLNGRPIGSNVNTYHGATDLNSIPVESIQRVELSSGTSATLYGSEAFGGVVNIITKQGQGIPKFNGLVEFGSLNQSNYHASYSGSAGSLDFNLSYEESEIDNRYRVPEGAANRDEKGRLFNGDTATSNYFGSVRIGLNPRNTLSFDAYKISSRRGLLYFGFPLQRDRLDHDVFNVGLSWNSRLSDNDDSVLQTTIGYNQDYFNTYGPTQSTFYRQGSLNSQALTARVEHQWRTASNNNLRWGLDVQQTFLAGDVLSTIPERAGLNETEDTNRFNGALFALNTWEISDRFQAELGIRQNFNSEFGSYLNPSAGLRWDINPSIAVRGSWVSVQRNPGLDQLYVYDTVHNWLPNPDLDPEKGSSWTAGFDINFTSNFTGQFTYFGSRLNDRLGIEAGKWANIGLVNTNGLEAALKWQIAPEWATFLNYTYTDARIETGTDKGLQLGLVPYSVAKAGIGYGSAGWEINLFASYNSGSRRAFFNNPDDNNTDFSPSFLNLDLSARVPITRNLGLTIYLENLTDKTYERVNRIYQPGLTFRIGLQSNF